MKIINNKQLKEKKYYVRSKYMNSLHNYLNLLNGEKKHISSSFTVHGKKTMFTISELKELGIQFNENNEPYGWTLEEVQG